MNYTLQDGVLECGGCNYPFTPPEDFDAFSEQEQRAFILGILHIYTNTPLTSASPVMLTQTEVPL